MRKYILFYVAMALNVIAILVSAYFLISDEASGSGNGLLVLVTLLLAGWIFLCWYLRKTQLVLATILAWIPAVPLLLYGLFVLMFIILSPDMR